MAIFDCCLNGDATANAKADNIAAHKQVLMDAGMSPESVQSIDAGHYQILEPVTQVCCGWRVFTRCVDQDR